MAKYRFRKMYFICENKRVINAHQEVAHAYQYKHTADTIFKHQPTYVKMWDINKPPPMNAVEGFYLVHESLFEEILKKYSK